MSNDSDIVHLNFGGEVNLCGAPRRRGLGPLEDTDPALLCRTCWRLSTIERRNRDAQNMETFNALRRDNIDSKLALLMARAHLAEITIGALSFGEALTSLIPSVNEEAAVEIRKMAAYANSFAGPAKEDRGQVVSDLREWWTATLENPALLSPKQVEKLLKTARLLGVDPRQWAVQP